MVKRFNEKGFWNLCKKKRIATDFTLKPFEYRGNQIEIYEPAEPTDVFWENLHVSKAERSKRKI
jgi:hypothetical protein